MQFHIKNIFLKEKTDFFQKRNKFTPPDLPSLGEAIREISPRPTGEGVSKKKEYMFSLVPMCSEYQKERISFLFFSLKSLENHYLK